MNTYNFSLRKIVTHRNHKSEVAKARIVFKTVNTEWVNSCDPMIALISLHSNFNEGVDGHLKMSGFINTLKENVRNNLTILLTEKAHFHALSLKYNHDLEKTSKRCLEDAESLEKRFASYFSGCKVAYWQDFVEQDPDYQSIQAYVHGIHKEDAYFRDLVRKDAEGTYTPQRSLEHPDKPLYIAKTELDLLEQCIYTIVAAKKGFKYDFYPGNFIASASYLNTVVCPFGKQITNVPVYLAIEKKYNPPKTVL